MTFGEWVAGIASVLAVISFFRLEEKKEPISRLYQNNHPVVTDLLKNGYSYSWCDTSVKTTTNREDEGYRPHRKTYFDWRKLTRVSITYVIKENENFILYKKRELLKFFFKKLSKIFLRKSIL